jgi:signal transduction histidine kinase
VRVKIWSADGRILYSDEPRIVGTRYALGEDEIGTLRSGQSEAEVSDLSRPENRFERQYRKLLEVYLGIRTPAGPRVLFETYQRYSSVAASGRRLWQTFLPALLGALVLLYLVQVPLAGSLVRRLRRGQREREELLRRAVEASELERRRIARDLHDGAVQTLAGVSYRLSAVSEPLRTAGRPEADAVAEAGTDVRRSIRELRTLLVDLYPPTLHQAGLGAAVSDLLAPLADRSIATELEVDPGLQLTPEAEALLFRAAQEALRNVAKHSEAEHVAVHVGRRDGHGLLEVRDDGRGFAPQQAPDVATGADNGHFGLRMIGDLARDAGGTVSVDSEPGRGTTVRVSVPA